MSERSGVFCVHVAGEEEREGRGKTEEERVWEWREEVCWWA